MWLQEWQVCQISVGVLGDISRALEEQLQPFCNRLMQILLENLQSDAVNRNVKPQILSAFGDIALAIGDKYEVYLSAVLSMLQSAQVSTTSAVWRQGGRDPPGSINCLQSPGARFPLITLSPTSPHPSPLQCPGT